jgi:hypothetical protein
MIYIVTLLRLLRFAMCILHLYIFKQTLGDIVASLLGFCTTGNSYGLDITINITFDCVILAVDVVR